MGLETLSKGPLLECLQQPLLGSHACAFSTFQRGAGGSWGASAWKGT